MFMHILMYTDRKNNLFQNQFNNQNTNIGGIPLILLHKTTLRGQFYTYGRFVPCESEQISSNCTAICNQEHTAKIFASLFTFVT